MRALTFVHRWLGIAFCLLFAMWFATGMVMHLVPFPLLTDRERIEGLATVESSDRVHVVANAVRSSGIGDADRVRLLQRVDGPIYVVSGPSGLAANRAADLSSAAVGSSELARAIAEDHGRRRGMDTSRVTTVGLAAHDQWTVPNGFDRHRPLYRVALGDQPGTELYVSSVTGEIVLDTTCHERLWSYFGSIAHWIYPTVLRRTWVAWDMLVWVVSLAALVAALSGAVLGITQLRRQRGRLLTPYRGLHAWHHGLGLVATVFLITWIFSGWLSMDHGRLFSTGRPTSAEVAAVIGFPDWQTDADASVAEVREIEWFAFAGRIYRRDRFSLTTQHLRQLGGTDDGAAGGRSFMSSAEITAAAKRLALACNEAVGVPPDDDYAMTSIMPAAPVFRIACGDVWIHVDGANGAMMERLDGSRRAYRWLYSALHTFDVPGLKMRPTLRSVLVLSLCGFGFVFSLTGVVIGWRRLRRL